MPICQDTGWAVVWVELGSGVRVQGGELYDAIQQGVAKGYKDGYLRKSIVEDPLRREEHRHQHAGHHLHRHRAR